MLCAATALAGQKHGAGAYSIPLCCGAFPHDGRLFCLLAGGRPAASYEDSVRLHETQFTAHFAALGYRWDTFVDTKDLASLFINPLWPAPSCCWRTAGARFSSAAAFFTPYADELRRTDGQAAAELYDYLKSETDYPVDDLLRALLPVQPLAAMAQNLHWHYILPQTAGECAPILLDANTLAKGCALQPDASTA